MDRRRALPRVRLRPSETAGTAPGKPEDYQDDGFNNNDQHKSSVGAPADPDPDPHPDPFLGVKMRRSASAGRECRGDYLNVQSYSYLTKFLSKQGNRNILFADKVLKFTESGKMKRRILLITDSAVYLVDPESENLKRRIALDAVGKLLLSELNDNFFALVVPKEYDCLMATTRKTEIVRVLVEAIKTRCQHEIGVTISNRFEYKASSDSVKEVHFEEVDGGVRTRILRKGGQ